MLVGTNEVSLSFFLFCCSASRRALASSVEMMFFIFALWGERGHTTVSALQLGASDGTECGLQAPPPQLHKDVILLRAHSLQLPSSPGAGVSLRSHGVRCSTHSLLIEGKLGQRSGELPKAQSQ